MPLVAMFKIVWELVSAAVEVEAKEKRLPVVREEVEAVKPVPVVRELKVQALVLAPIANDWLPEGATMEFHLTAKAPGSVQVIGSVPPAALVKT